MKKTKRGTPEKLVCDFCGAEKKEITFTIGACSEPGADWCMIYGTGKMACPACYARAMEEAQNKGRAIERKEEAKPAPAAQVQEVEAELLPATKAAADAFIGIKQDGTADCTDYTPAQAKAPAMTFKTCCVCGAGTRGAQHWNRDNGFGVCPVCVVSMKCKGTSDAEIKSLYGVEGVNYPSLAEADAELAKPPAAFSPALKAAADEAVLLSAPIQEEPAPGSFESKDAAAALRPILDRLIKSVYLPDYRAKVTDAEALGVLIAKFFKWDGGEILAAVYAALEDANYHAENRIIERMQKGEDVEALIQDMAKELRAMHSEYQKDCAGGCPTLELIKRAKGE